ncbi:MAG: hypothetical protein AAGF88_04955 [Pseudomonadota bacterium]
MSAAMPPEEIRVRLAPESRALLEAIKRDAGFSSDGEAIRAALSLQHHVARRLRQGHRLFLADDAGTIIRELATRQ